MLTPEQKESRRKAREANQENERRAFALKVEGFTFAQIADRLGFAAPSTAMRAYERYLAKTADLDTVEQHRELELRRLDALHAAWYPLAVGQPAGANAPSELAQPQGAVKPDFDALSAVLRIHDRRVRLLGLHREPTVDPDDFVRQAALDAGLSEDDAEYAVRAAQGIVLTHGKGWGKR